MTTLISKAGATLIPSSRLISRQEMQDLRVIDLLQSLLGNRYDLCGKDLPYLKQWAEVNAGFDFTKTSPKQADMDIHAPNFNHAFLEELGENNFSRRSFFKWERIMHSHGATIEEVHLLRHGKFSRCVDVVIYPGTHE